MFSDHGTSRSWREEGRLPRQVANGPLVDKAPGPQVASEAPAIAVRAAWLPVLSGQAVPMLNERRRDDGEPYDYR